MSIEVLNESGEAEVNEQMLIDVASFAMRSMDVHPDAERHRGGAERDAGAPATAGVPGRNEIGDQQELHYPAICRAIRDTGFKGYLAQEFTPAAPDPVASLREAIRLCDV